MWFPRGERGSTLLDAVVGTALMLVVFVGIAGAFRLAVMAVGNNKARAGAIALANERLEFIRSLSYNAVGTSGGIPSGVLAQEESIELNDVPYTRRTFISYEDDPADGLGGADENAIETDYKAVKTQVSWTGRDGVHTIELLTRISPVGIESAVPGGTLAIEVVDAALAPVSSAEVTVVNPTIVPPIDLTRFTDADGRATILGVPPGAGYEISVTKSGYSSAQTYAADATNTNPIPAHLGVALDTTTAGTFAIDLVSEKRIETYTPVTISTTTETFANSSGTASTSNTTIAGGVVSLTESAGEYPFEGTFISNVVSTSSLVRWNNFTWDANEPVGTAVYFQFYGSDGVTLLSNTQLPGNEGGFTSSPVNLSTISTSTFPGLVVRGRLTTGDASTTPSVDAWRLSFESGPHPVPDVPFMLRGAKTIGTTAGGALIYKYEEEHSSGAGASFLAQNLEWDAYTVIVSDTSGYDISSACAPQPETLTPNSSQTTRLTLSPHTTNSLLVDVKTSAGAVIPGATLRLARAGYDETRVSDTCGNGFWSAISSGSVGGGNPYTIEVSAAGYQTFNSSEVNVSGTSRLSIILNTL